MTWRARFLTLLVVWAIGLALAAVPERAAAAESAPTTLTPQQMDQLVDKISDAVIAKLQAAGRLSGDAEPSPPVAPTADADKPAAPSFMQQTETVLAAIPTLPHYLGRLVEDLRGDANGGRSLGNFLLRLVVAVMVALAAEAAIWLAFARLRERLDRRAGAQRGAGSLLDVAGIAVLDAVGVVAVWLIMVGFTRIWFDGAGPQDLLAIALLKRVVWWRAFLWAARIVLRPWAPGARLAALDDNDARQIYRTLAAIALIVLAVRLVRLNLPPDTPEPTLDAATTVFSLLALALFVLAAFRCRRPIARWFESLAGSPIGPGAVLARHWLWIGVPFFCVLVGAQIYGAITDRVTVPTAVFLTLITVVGLILIETVFKAVSIRLGSPSDPRIPGRPPMPRLIDLILRCARVAILIGAIVLVAESWTVDVLGLVDPAGWSNLTRSSLVAAASLFAAYVACEIVRFATDRLVARQVSAGQPGSGLGPSRLATMIPMLRTTLFVLIVCVATLVALSDLGVNITPLIAGASVFGLAISFGSQTLVRDIVSGIFFLADDAFRVGEYIDTGSAKGTVDGFTLRSIKLRHQNGQIHTIPFGTLGRITNFSRDWSIVKFNMRFTRDTDLEKLRKTVKRIGLEMAEDPELQGDILETLKMQGVADIEETAILVRFKFTARPTRPTLVQREAIKRMVKAFAAEGIHFAGATPVLALSGPPVPVPAVAAG